MFRKELKERFESIFQIPKTTFDAPSDAFEQDTLFIEVVSSPARFSSGNQAFIKVTGQIVMYSQDNRLPFGFFGRKIEQASKELVRPLFFYDVDSDNATSPARMINLHERRCSFIFLYKAQYDPNQGELNELDIVLPEDLTPPSAPTNLARQIYGSENENAVLTWQDNSSFETSFRVYRSLHSNFSDPEMIAEVSAGVVSYDETGATQLVRNYYRVTAFAEHLGESTPSNIVYFNPGSE